MTPVSETAAVARIRRRLAHAGLTLRMSRQPTVVASLGEAYVTDSNNNIIAFHCSIVDLVLGLRVLAEGEVLVRPEGRIRPFGSVGRRTLIDSRDAEDWWLACRDASASNTASGGSTGWEERS